MAEPLKNMYSPTFFERLCPVLSETIPGFDKQAFIYSIFDEQWPELELKQRVRKIAIALRAVLPSTYPAAINIIKKIAVTLRKLKFQEQGFAMIFLADFIEVFGQDHFDESMTAIEEVTQLVSCEFAIRPFLLKHPQETFSHLLKWSKHKNPSVRRLASEGCRPRLPWAMGIPLLKKDPTPILTILENLKCDDAEYVRRSVANNLNDIAKDHPDLVLDIAQRWNGSDINTDWIIRHGCRTLLKKGNTNALLMQGINPLHKAKIKTFTLKAPKVKIGDHLEFEFNFINEENTSSKFRLDYAINYLTSTGKISTRVFKITENTFESKRPFVFKRKQSFRDLTTRKHHKGTHTICILVNGRKRISKEFHVL